MMIFRRNFIIKSDENLTLGQTESKLMPTCMPSFTQVDQWMSILIYGLRDLKKSVKGMVEYVMTLHVNGGHNYLKDSVVAVQPHQIQIVVESSTGMFNSKISK